MEYQDAVDLILQFSGETPVNAPNEHPLQGVITRFLNSVVSREQLLDWWFNTDYEFNVTSEDGGKVLLSAQLKTIVFDNPNYVARGLYVYDRQNQTFQLGVPVLILKAIRELDWDELPELMQQWCMFQTAKYYILSTIGDSTILAELKQESQKSYLMLKNQDIQSKNVNIFSTPTIAKTRAGRRPYGGR